MHTLAALALCALIACGGSSAPRPAAPAVVPAVDARKAESDAKGLVVEIYDTVSRGKTDSLFSLLSERLVVFGPRATDATTTRSDALVALGKVVDPKAKRHAAVHSGGFDVVTSPGGHSAWMSDVLSIGGDRFAVTAVLTNSDELWAVSAAALAEMPSGRQIKAEAARDAIVPPGAAAAGKLDPRAADAVERFKKGLLDQQVWGDDLAARGDAVVIGPTAGDVSRGKAAIQRAWKARLRSKVREATSGETTAAMTPDGQLVWISAPVTRVADDEDPMPLRIFAIYEKDAAGWKMIALHEALAFGDAGAGAAFKKVLPPAPPPPEPPKVEDKKPEVTERAAPTDKKPEAQAKKAKKTNTAKKAKPKKKDPPAESRAMP
ncbi:MAG TPA: nuclear transport factor 2 family protein [Kofleriaceae bacterium]|nr:nuclear transport factor 2 family protein [Kofleriaceae bacterium]